MLVEGAQFGATAPPEVEWIVEGVIQKGGNGIVTGEPKAGKSLLMMDLLLAVATGTPWLGFNVSRRVKCALISREDYPGMTQQRTRAPISWDRSADRLRGVAVDQHPVADADVPA